tara:strand:+ start:4304 stop:5035 length:732 start_codon:yes stop_codon:yes gene_type:complete
MPFTFAHPAIILPLAHLPRKWFSLTGLVIGSLTPDFEYFLRMAIKSDHSHTVGGLLWFDLPLGLAISFIFHNLVRDRLFDNLPRFLKSRFGAFTEFDWNGYFKKNWMVVIISILLGAISHIFWDGFTHDHGYFVGLIPTLSNTVGLFGGHTPIFKILQHASTLVGGTDYCLFHLQTAAGPECEGKYKCKLLGYCDCTFSGHYNGTLYGRPANGTIWKCNSDRYLRRTFKSHPNTNNNGRATSQ